MDNGAATPERAALAVTDPPAGTIRFPGPLRPRPEDDALVARADGTARRLGPHLRVLDERFVIGAGRLGEALRGLAGMREMEFAADLADELSGRLEPVVAALERAVDDVCAALSEPAGKGARRRAGRARAGEEASP